MFGELASFKAYVGIKDFTLDRYIAKRPRLEYNQQVNSYEDLQKPQIRICESLQFAGEVSSTSKVFYSSCFSSCQSLNELEPFWHH